MDPRLIYFQRLQKALKEGVRSCMLLDTFSPQNNLIETISQHLDSFDRIITLILTENRIAELLPCWKLYASSTQKMLKQLYRDFIPKQDNYSNGDKILIERLFLPLSDLSHLIFSFDCKLRHAQMIKDYEQKEQAQKKRASTIISKIVEPRKKIRISAV